jgi:3-mercaptopyruvate sulfurtransferase SseA
LITRLVASFVVIVCALGTSASAHPVDETGVAFITADEVRRLSLGTRRIIFVDVRSAAEFQEGRIRGSVNVPLTEIERRFAEIPREPLVVLY